MRRIRAPGRRGLREIGTFRTKRADVQVLVQYLHPQRPPLIGLHIDVRFTQSHPGATHGVRLYSAWASLHGRLMRFLNPADWTLDKAESITAAVTLLARRWPLLLYDTLPRHEIAPAHTKAHTDDKQTRQQPCAHTRSGLERTLVRGVFIRAPAPALSPTTRTSLFPRRCACRRPDLSHVFYLFLSGA